MYVIHNVYQAACFFENSQLPVRPGSGFKYLRYIVDNMTASQLIYHIVYKIQQLIN